MDPNEADALLSQQAAPTIRRRPNKLQKKRLERKPLPPIPPPEPNDARVSLDALLDDTQPHVATSQDHHSDHDTGSVRSVVNKVVEESMQAMQAVLALPKAGFVLVKNVAEGVVARLKRPLPPLPPLPPIPSWREIRGAAGRGVGILGKGLSALAPFSWQGSYQFLWR